MNQNTDGAIQQPRDARRAKAPQSDRIRLDAIAQPTLRAVRSKTARTGADPERMRDHLARFLFRPAGNPLERAEMKHSDRFWRSRAAAKEPANEIRFRVMLMLALAAFIVVSALRLHEILRPILH